MKANHWVSGKQIVGKLNLKEPRSGWNLDSKRGLQYVKQKKEKKRKKKELKKKADFDRETVWARICLVISNLVVYVRLKTWKLAFFFFFLFLNFLISVLVSYGGAFGSF